MATRTASVFTFTQAFPLILVETTFIEANVFSGVDVDQTALPQPIPPTIYTDTAGYVENEY